MKVVKVRRVGNSNVVSLPREFEEQGYLSGASVLVEELPEGGLRLMLTEQVRERIGGIGRRLIDEHQEALRSLAEDDPDTASLRHAAGHGRRADLARTRHADVPGGHRRPGPGAG